MSNWKLGMNYVTIKQCPLIESIDIVSKTGFDGFGFWTKDLRQYESSGDRIEDLVKAKKTQRDKDWPMIRRLVDAHYDEFEQEPHEDRVRFWLRESRTPEVLIAVAAEHPEILRELIPQRPLLSKTLGASRTALQQELEKERIAEQEADKVHWEPLIRELELLRQNHRTPGPG